MSKAPQPTTVFRMAHIDNLRLFLRRGGLHSTNHAPDDGLAYRTIHDVSVQDARHTCRIPCGPGGTVHDYVPFYFGVLSPMLLRLKTGQVEGYNEGQRPLIYLVTTAQAATNAGLKFVFSDGHGLAAFTDWFDDLADLGKVDWAIVRERYWADCTADMDRQRRKQAEFLVHRFLPWTLVMEIGVFDAEMRARVAYEIGQHDADLIKPVSVRRNWYY